MEKDVFIVIAYRWGFNGDHSYTLGAFTEISDAIKCADSHAQYRGGKYACVVEKCILDKFDDEEDNYTEEVYRAKSNRD